MPEPADWPCPRCPGGDLEPTAEQFTYDQERQLDRLNDIRLYPASVRAVVRCASVYAKLGDREEERYRAQGKDPHRFQHWHFSSGTRLASLNAVSMALRGHGVHKDLCHPLATRLIASYNPVDDDTIPEDQR